MDFSPFSSLLNRMTILSPVLLPSAPIGTQRGSLRGSRRCWKIMKMMKYSIFSALLECGGRIPRCTAHETHAWSGCRCAHLSLRNAPPLFQQLFAKSAGFCRQRGPPGRHSEREMCGFDSIFVSLRRYSGISFQRHQNFSPS